MALSVSGQLTEAISVLDYFFFAQRDPAYLYSTARRCHGEVLLLKELHRTTASIPQGSELLTVKLAWYPCTHWTAWQNKTVLPEAPLSNAESTDHFSILQQLTGHSQRAPKWCSSQDLRSNSRNHLQQTVVCINSCRRRSAESNWWLCTGIT